MVVSGKCLCVVLLGTRVGPAELVGMLGYGITTALLVAACYHQRATWCGINLAIFTFAQQLLQGDFDCATARRQWREAVSLMRVTSRVYQRSFAFLCATTLLVFFATLFDIQQGQAPRKRHHQNRSRSQALDSLPSLILAASLMSAPFMAASATAH